MFFLTKADINSNYKLAIKFKNCFLNSGIILDKKFNIKCRNIYLIFYI